SATNQAFLRQNGLLGQSLYKSVFGGVCQNGANGVCCFLICVAKGSLRILVLLVDVINVLN
ncbi:MAG TPA: hypothetical protein VEQ34_11455, partial [Pyrinomonadaceae bacterium]|nr:hypothetical protein [Pyrinomonadaceae bacterium]